MSNGIAHFLRRHWGGAFASAVATAVAALFLLGYRPHVETARCPEGLVAQGARCCAPGQSLVGASCQGSPATCPHGFTLYRTGCAVEPKKIEIAGGLLKNGPVDWQNANRANGPTPIAPFLIDAFEVSVQSWEECASRGKCASLPKAPNPTEPGHPVTRITPAQAEAFCRQSGGRLPSLQEWVWVASGAEERRFPWGPNGLVCRRASFGLVAGPCAEGSGMPELSGARPDGQTPLGVADLAGNVAEWARAADGRYRALGGSFRSRVAGELSVNAAFDGETPRDHIGFRCVYAPEAPSPLLSNERTP
ncbi:MAG: SUMF1/EgtB/PvdO family nonheme iron enzyme [Polyangiaceae bacterium]|nr:SUMF1/EgtB/PvdO family nonheme iron enzyme [Polyangiaceae bacterium]